MYIFVCTQSAHTHATLLLIISVQMQSIRPGSLLDIVVGRGLARDGRRAPKHRSIDLSSANAGAESPPIKHLSVALQVSHVAACYFRSHVTDIAAAVGNLAPLVSFVLERLYSLAV